MIALLIASQVARVVVFPDRAQVIRAAEVACAAGPVQVEFPALPPSADPGSLRAITSAGSVESVASVETPKTAAFSAEAAELEAKVRGLEDERAALRDARKNADRQIQLAGKLEAVAAGRIGQEVSRPDVEAWRRSLQQTLKARLDAVRKRSDARTRERELQRKLAELRRRLAAQGVARERKERAAHVVVSCPQGRPATVELSYLVGGASWEPAYEARAEDEAVMLSLHATVRQSTGESWEGAAVSLSTAVPSEDATPPELHPLRVFAEPRPPPRKVLVRRDEHQRHAEEADSEGADEEALSVRLAAKGPGVRGDGTPARLFIAQTRLAATFAWKTVPRQVPNVFHVAELINTAPFPLLPGPVELFRGGYLGKLPLERVAQGQRFHLSFGLAEEVKVKRVVLEEIARDKGLFKSSQRFHYA
ncbi:MAG TPA: mucoidy inhibitor MuiA family protein, partial [Myxococcales bacterium]|nr:mucoidy inhibitor MuiA family protein [Myxococcales bacterium]